MKTELQLDESRVLEIRFFSLGAWMDNLYAANPSWPNMAGMYELLQNK